MEKRIAFFAVASETQQLKVTHLRQVVLTIHDRTRGKCSIAEPSLKLKGIVVRGGWDAKSLY